MKYVYCPAAIRTALVAAGVDLRKLTNLEKLANIVSPEDVAFYIYINIGVDDKGQNILPIPAVIRQSLTNAVVFNDEAGTPPWDLIQTNANEIKRVANEYSLNGNAPALQIEGKKLVCDLMDENTILFSHVPLAAGEASDKTPEGQRVLLDRLIQQLLANGRPFEEVARLPLFGGYLRATQTLAV